MRWIGWHIFAVVNNPRLELGEFFADIPADSVIFTKITTI
jgi:hypothetical protein